MNMVILKYAEQELQQRNPIVGKLNETGIRYTVSVHQDHVNSKDNDVLFKRGIIDDRELSVGLDGLVGMKEKWKDGRFVGNLNVRIQIAWWISGTEVCCDKIAKNVAICEVNVNNENTMNDCDNNVTNKLRVNNTVDSNVNRGKESDDSGSSMKDKMVSENKVQGAKQRNSNFIDIVNALKLDKRLRCRLVKIGNGQSIHFWSDTWVGNSPLSDSFPRLFRIETNPSCTVCDRVPSTLPLTSATSLTSDGIFHTLSWPDLNPLGLGLDSNEVGPQISHMGSINPLACNSTGNGVGH
ncbi:hypothetical protein Tco_0873331 [Tanacetum coccineum]